MDGSQLRMARAALKMGVRELGELAQVSPNTITRIEADLPSNPSTILAVRSALEKAGVIFVSENGGGAGVRLKKTPLAVAEITEKIHALDETIATIPVEGPPSPCSERANEAEKAPSEGQEGTGMICQSRRLASWSRKRR
jgi:DNA-binding XRE family transcriptional regulator